MEKKPNTLAYWREGADRALGQAKTMRDTVAKQLLLNIAACYTEMARCPEMAPGATREDH